MAGVGFSLRALEAGESLTGRARLYAIAGVISSGPWLISMLTQLLVGVLARGLVDDAGSVTRFQVCVTWLFAASIIFTSPIQLTFTRYTADLLYARRTPFVTPSLFAVLSITSALAATFACAVSLLFETESLAVKVLLGTAFVTLCCIWLIVGVLTGLKAFAPVIGSFVLGYGATLVATMGLARYGLVGLLAGFVIGQLALLGCGLAVLVSKLPHCAPTHFGMLERGQARLDLLLIGFLLGASVWVDKVIFWFDPLTSYSVIGPLRASEVYDLPIFFAYLTIVPGMAVFLLRVETDYAERHAAFYRAILDGAPLASLERLRDDVTSAARRALTDIFTVQGLVFLACVAAGPSVLRYSGFSELHLPLFYVDAFAVSVQVLFVSIVSIFFYLDRRRSVLLLTLLLFLTNTVATLATLRLGSEYFGYGFCVAMCISSVAGIAMLTRAFRHLVRDTFMLQGAST